ncbi:MAG: radical SAM protein [Chloroflexi bacterium]|nr:radical SAM protein [Chloroflexota bacterium]MBU1750327.1 radical SAM protein [Chloroflexota bacterium]
MNDWLSEWGERPARKVRTYWWPPSLLLRQLGSALYMSALVRWRQLPYWAVNYGVKCIPGAAGSRGQGCIGFPAHPVWEMTAACNLRCIHCHTSGGQRSPDELTTQEAKRLFDQLAEVSEFRMMAYTGGEPLMRGDLMELLAYSQALGFTNTIATNATLIDDAVARDLRRYGVAIGAVSLDGFDAATHDYVRNQPGAFDAALRGIEALRRAGIPLHINITAMEYNLDQLESLMGLLDELGTAILIMYQLVPVGRGHAIEQAALDLGANERLIRFMAQAQRVSQAIMEPVAGPQYWPFLLQQNGIRGGPLLRLAETVFHGCSAGRGFVYIKPNGEVWPCPFIEVPCGNVRETPFKTIWADAPIFQDLRDREHRLQGRCGECEYRKLCGGCRGRTLAVTGNLLAEDPSCFIHANQEQTSEARKTPEVAQAPEIG